MTPPEPQPLAGTIPRHLQDRLQERMTHPVDLGPEARRETPEEATERRRRQSEGTHARWSRRLPPMYEAAALTDLDPASVRGGDWTWRDDSLNLTLAGAVGTGKTHAAYAYANTAVDAGLVAEAWTLVDLLEAMRPGQEAERADMWCRRADVLVLDDLGATKVSEWASEQITGLVDERIRMKRRTIVTTNLTEDQLQATWGGRVMDRLAYRRTVKVLLGESRRRGGW